ncbi:MAG: hypothetical protein IJS95_05440 [Prevotella sp.]|nr:hypothetical protein [Prevotella sp.]
MQKKEYMTPVVEVMEVKANQLLMTSGVTSNNGIGFGGVDEDGALDPAAPPGLPSMGELVGLPDFIFK